MTLRWWNDLWLNEGFASYVEYLGADSAEPSWNIVSAGPSDVGHRACVWDLGHVCGAQSRVILYRARVCCVEHRYGMWGMCLGPGAWVWGMRHGRQVYGTRHGMGI